MKITIIVGGRFHAFDLAEQLQNHNVQLQLLTTYPKGKVTKFGLRPKYLSSAWFVEYYIRIHKLILSYYPSNYSLSVYFDNWASKRIRKDSDFYIIWAGFGLRCIQRIRRINPKATIVLERGSSHILEQHQLLSAIGENQAVHPKMIEREMKEYEAADYIAIPSTFSKSTFIKHGVEADKLFINPYGVSLQGFKSPDKVVLNKTLKIGYAGSLSARKNILGLIQAAQIAINSGISLELHLVGTIDKKSFDAKILDSFKFIHYHKAVPQHELIEFYHGLDLFTLNSVEDGYGMVILQALACGVPVIASDHSGGPDVIKNHFNGLIVPSGDSDALAKAFIEISQRPELLAKMKSNASASVSTGFSWQDYGNRYHEFLSSIHE